MARQGTESRATHSGAIFFAPAFGGARPFAYDPFIAEIKRPAAAEGKPVQTYTHLFIGLVVLVFELGAYWETRRQRAVLREWANAHGLTLLKCRAPIFQSLAMLINTSGKQSLARVTVYDPRIRSKRSGQVRLGSYWQGLLNKDAIEVEWDHA
jgi:hypothetical protein